MAKHAHAKPRAWHAAPRISICATTGELTLTSAARSGDGATGRATRAAAAAGLIGSAAGSATGRQRVGKSPEFGCRIVRLRQIGGQGFQLPRHFAKKIEEERPPVKQMFDVDQRCRQAQFLYFVDASIECRLAILFQA